MKKISDISTGILTVPAYAVADPGGLGGPSHLFLYQTGGPPLSKGRVVQAPPPPPYVNVWIQHCYVTSPYNITAILFLGHLLAMVSKLAHF